jgi:hypothetical protein
MSSIISWLTWWAHSGRRGGQLVSNDERDQTRDQMLAEMDGFDPVCGVVVIAATNPAPTTLPSGPAGPGGGPPVDLAGDLDARGVPELGQDVRHMGLDGAAG